MAGGWWLRQRLKVMVSPFSSVGGMRRGTVLGPAYGVQYNCLIVINTTVLLYSVESHTVVSPCQPAVLTGWWLLAGNVNTVLRTRSLLPVVAVKVYVLTRLRHLGTYYQWT